MSDKKEGKDKKRKKQQSILEAEIFALINKSMKTVIETALDDIFKDWK